MKKGFEKLLIWIGAMVFFLCFATQNVTASQKTQTQEFFYGTDQTLEGIYGDNLFYFEVPEYWNVQNAQAEIEISVSPMLIDVPATLTFFINEVPFYTAEIDYRRGDEQTISVKIPKENIGKGYNVLGITGYARIYDEEGCLDELTGANWVSIKKNSCVRISYQLKEARYELKDYPYPILSTTNITGKGIQIVVPGKVSSGELTAAAWVRAGLADKVKGKDEIQMVYDNQYDKYAGSAIVVGLYPNLKEEFQSLLSNQGVEISALKTAAVVCMGKNEEGNGIIIVTSQSEEELIHAAQFLMDEDRISQETGHYAYVKKSENGLEQKNSFRQWEYTIAELSGSSEGIYMKGPFHNEQTVFLTNSTGHVLGTEGSMDLHFRYSENLDFNRSVFTVFVNDIPVASKKLQKAQAANDTMTVSFPADLIGKKITSIKFAFDLELPDTYCTPRGDDMPWAYITGESMVYLPVGNSTLLNFELMPYPFVKGSIFDNTTIVVPDKVTQEELQLLGQIVSIYGAGALPYTDFEVAKVQDTTTDGLKDRNAIILGTFNDLPLREEFGENLPFAMDIQNGRFMSNEQMLLSENYAKTMAALQMIPSIYNPDRVMLIITAADETILSNVTTFLREQDAKEQLKGDTVIIDHNLESRSFEYQVVSESFEKPTLRERIETHQESLIFTLVSASGILLLLIAAILILIRAKSVRKHS